MEPDLSYDLSDFLLMLDNSGEYNKSFDKLVHRYIIWREKRRREEARKERSERNRKARGDIVRKALFLAAIVWISYVTYRSIQYTQAFNYHGDFGALFDNVIIPISIAFSFIGITYGMNQYKGFFLDKHMTFWIIAYILYALTQTVLFYKYTKDAGGLIVIPLIFFVILFCVHLIIIISSKIFK